MSKGAAHGAGPGGRWNESCMLHTPMVLGTAASDSGGAGKSGDEPSILVCLDTLPFSHFSISTPTLTYHDAWNRRDVSRERVQCSIFVKSLLLATPLFGNV